MTDLSLGPCEGCENEVRTDRPHTVCLDGPVLCADCSPNLSEVVEQWEECVLREDRHTLAARNLDSFEELNDRIADARSYISANGDCNFAHWACSTGASNWKKIND